MADQSECDRIYFRLTVSTITTPRQLFPYAAQLSRICLIVRSMVGGNCVFVKLFLGICSVPSSYARQPGRHGTFTLCGPGAHAHPGLTTEYSTLCIHAPQQQSQYQLEVPHTLDMICNRVC
jgi:hypothetical protein